MRVEESSPPEVDGRGFDSRRLHHSPLLFRAYESFDPLPVVSLDERANHCLVTRPSTPSRLLIPGHERRVADDVGEHDRGEGVVAASRSLSRSASSRAWDGHRLVVLPRLGIVHPE